MQATSSNNPRHLTCVAIVAACVALCAAGCVQRRFTIRSNPPGALVYIDDYEIGTTPVSTDFVYYGTRKIRLVKDGYETLTILQPVPAPWYQFPGIDFVTDNLVPGEIRDERILDYQMQPQVIVPYEQLIGRADELRRASHTVAPAPSMPPPNFAPAAEPLPAPGAAPLPAPAPAPAPALSPPTGFDRFNY
jgi:hypothetical protein